MNVVLRKYQWMIKKQQYIYICFVLIKNKIFCSLLTYQLTIVLVRNDRHILIDNYSLNRLY